MNKAWTFFFLFAISLLPCRSRASPWFCTLPKVCTHQSQLQCNELSIVIGIYIYLRMLFFDQARHNGKKSHDEMEEEKKWPHICMQNTNNNTKGQGSQLAIGKSSSSSSRHCYERVTPWWMVCIPTRLGSEYSHTICTFFGNFHYAMNIFAIKMIWENNIVTSYETHLHIVAVPGPTKARQDIVSDNWETNHILSSFSILNCDRSY